MIVHRRRLAATVIGGVALALLSIGSVAAHTIQHAGPYTLAIGWQREPAFTGQLNAVQVIVTDGGGKPVDDLAADDLKVVVSTGGQQSQPFSFEPSFDEDTGLGTHGEYDAAIMPTDPGEYTFHLSGSIHGQKVDLTVTSSDSTFEAVQGTTDIEFPTKLPTLAELTTRITAVDARVSAAQGAGSAGKAAIDAASAEAAAAQRAADRALAVGAGLGIIAIVVGSVGVLLAIRGRRSSQA